MPQLSIIILNYNVKYFLDACLQSVQKAIANFDAEIIVADNASTDGSKEYYKDKYPNVKFLWLDKNEGFAKGNNQAVQQAKGEYLLILNPDTLMAENVLQVLFDFIKDKPDFGIVGGKMIDGTGHILPESKRGIPTPIVAFSKLTKLYKILRFKPFHNYYAMHLNDDKSGKVDVLTGAFMFIKKNTYQQVGGFDEQYFMYGEDIDLSYTVLKNGFQNYYCAQAKIIHFKGESSQKGQQYFNRFLNTTFLFQQKHFRTFPAQQFLMKLFFRIWLWLRIKKTNKTPIPETFANVYYIGNDENYKNLKKHYPEIKQISLDVVPNDNNAKSLLIFESESIPYSRIIEQMEKLKDRQIYFRFYIPKSQFVLGSDTKDRLGEVKCLS